MHLGRRPSLSPRARSALSALSALTVLALVLGQLVSTGHHVLVAHYVCVQHGSLHHGEPSSSIRAPSVSDTSVSAGAANAHGGHDDCSFPAREREAISEPRAVATSASDGANARLGSWIFDASAKPSLSLLSQAPKQSPPTIA